MPAVSDFLRSLFTSAPPVTDPHANDDRQGPLGKMWVDSYGREMMQRPDGTIIHTGRSYNPSDGDSQSPDMYNDPDQRDYNKYNSTLPDNAPNVKAFAQRQVDRDQQSNQTGLHALIKLLSQGR